jgi:mRNA-degrading endonuclease YafQ of YafQ-DinJ toxin-antitoxin module
MKRVLLWSSAFKRAAKKIAKRQPHIAAGLEATLAALSDDAFDPALRTHKLAGELSESWACSAAYDFRIVFSFVTHDGVEAILLESIGTHDEVY